MNIPADLKYTESHEWVRAESDGTVTVGITEFAQDALGDIVFVELPKVGTTYGAGDDAAVVESVKAASDIYAPIAGEVVAVNEDVASAPESINTDAYSAWLFKIKPADAAAINSLMDAAAYGKTTEA
ncbi:glycine cleavage system protein GcvH [Duganella hordei]|uniref:glycine cleavage system protein GcvH n=1 Tax=Duganella hordei TaxID=2865934 RepID=UPI0030EA23E2